MSNGLLGSGATVTRRSFVRNSALGGLAVAASGGAVSGMFSSALASEGSASRDGEVAASSALDSAAGDGQETVCWSHCHVNCGGQCPLQLHVVDDEIVSVSPDTTGDPSFGAFQPRACLRGRSIRRWINGADRLNYPMRRVEGTARGEGKYERISWDEALDTIADEFTRIREAYGNESIFIQECSGVEQNFMMNNPFFRLFNLLGGEVTRYGNYSNGSLSFGALPYTYGGNVMARPFRDIQEGELVVLFGNAPSDTRMAGDGAGYDLNYIRETKHAQIVVIDPRRSDVACNQGVEWVPIRPGTDAALVAGIAHELIAADLVDVDFLHTYCVGYDEETLPEGAPANSSYYAYVMGTGYDMVEKTPQWAAEVTQVPAERIVDLAHRIGQAKPCYIAQGWGPQRRTNGDHAARAIMLLPQLVGQVGKPGTNSGAREGNDSWSCASLPTGDNPVQAKFANFMWPEVIDHGDQMTATNAGIKKADALSAPIKMLVNYGNNMMSNQNGDINATTDILRDESKCEFILQYDVVWSDSCNWADIVLPDLTPQETWMLTGAGENSNYHGIWVGKPSTSAKFERREVYEVCADLAKRLGVYDEYTDGGKTREDWCKALYEETVADIDETLPSWDEMLEQGIYKGALIEPSTENDPFIDDPEANPLETATGKIQVYSPELAEMAQTWELPEGDRIYPIPAYFAGYEGPDANTDEYPFQMVGYHTKAHTHSTYANNEIIQAAHPHVVWINPLDADGLGISSGDQCRVTSPHGTILIEARVTPRIIPGCLAIPQGSWHSADMQGDRVDHGGCINTLSSRHCTPIAKQTGQNTAICRIEKA